MDFAVGQRVRINVGQNYGKVGVVTYVNGDRVDVRLYVGAASIPYECDALIDLYANNGD